MSQSFISVKTLIFVNQIGLNLRETLDLTHAMVKTGKTLSWPSDLVVDKHCVGGLPGNRTTLIA